MNNTVDILKWLKRAKKAADKRAVDIVEKKTAELAAKVKGSLLEKASSSDEVEYADSVKMVKKGNRYVIASTRRKTSSGESVSRVSRAMEYGTKAMQARPVWRKFDRA